MSWATVSPVSDLGVRLVRDRPKKKPMSKPASTQPAARAIHPETVTGAW
jgi:hypothetical protein